MLGFPVHAQATSPSPEWGSRALLRSDFLRLGLQERPGLVSEKAALHGISEMETQFGDKGGWTSASYFCVPMITQMLNNNYLKKKCLKMKVSVQG